MNAPDWLGELQTWQRRYARMAQRAQARGTPVSSGTPREKLENAAGWRLYRYGDNAGPPLLIVFALVNRPDVLDLTPERSLIRAGLWDEVKDRLDQPGTGLSGGQQQRLCIARTIAVSPEVILMDEPCSALDPIATAKVEELIDELRENYTIAIVTHSMQQAARVSQRTAYFHLGNLVEVGGTTQIFTNPQHKLTEDYITGRFG